MSSNVMTDTDLLLLIKEILEIDKDISMDTYLNIFEYDSYAKINLIVSIETYCRKRLDINRFLLCDTFRDIIDLIQETKGSD